MRARPRRIGCVGCISEQLNLNALSYACFDCSVISAEGKNEIKLIVIAMHFYGCPLEHESLSTILFIKSMGEIVQQNEYNENQSHSFQKVFHWVHHFQKRFYIDVHYFISDSPAGPTSWSFTGTKECHKSIILIKVAFQH